MSCQEKIIAEFSKKVRPTEFKKIFKEIDDLKKLDPTISERDLMEKVIDKRKAYLFKKARILKQVERGDEHVAYINQSAQIDGVSVKNMEDAIFGLVSRNGKYQHLNVENQYMSTLGDYMNHFQELKDKGFFKILKDKKNSPEFFKEVAQGVWAKANKTPMKYKYPQSAEAVDVIHALNKKRLLDLQNAGFDVADLSGYVYSGSYDPMIVRKFGFDTFKKAVLEGVDMTKQLKKWGSKDIDENLKAIYDDITTSDLGEARGLSNLGEAVKEMADPDRVNRMVSAHRTLMFKDGESFYKFFEKYSGNNLMESVLRDSKRTARIVAKTNVFGTAPEIGIDQLIQAANKHLTANNLEPLGKKFRQAVGTTVDMALGQGLITDNLVVRSARVAKNFSMMALLGKAAPKAFFTDPVMAANVMSNLTHENYYVSMAKFFDEYGKTISSSKYRDEIAKRSNLLMREYVHDIMEEAQGTSGFERGVAKMTNMFIEISGLNLQAKAARNAIAKNTLHHLADIHEGRISPELQAKDLASLKAYGFSDQELALMKASVSDLQGTRIVDPAVLREMDPAKLREVLGDPTRKIQQVVKDTTLAEMEKELKYAANDLKNIKYTVGGKEQIAHAQKVLDEAKLVKLKHKQMLAETPLGKQIETLRMEKQRLYAKSKQNNLTPEDRTLVMSELAKARTLFNQAEKNHKLSANYKELTNLEADITKKRMFRNDLQRKLGNVSEVKAAQDKYELLKTDYEKAKEGVTLLNEGEAPEGFVVSGDKILREVDQALPDKELAGIARNAAQKISSYAQDYALLGSPTPTAVINYKMAGGMDPSTPAGAVMSLILQFKAFGASVYRVYRNAAWADKENQGSKAARYIKGGRGAMAYTMLTGSVVGAGVNMLTDVLDGKVPRDPTADPLNFINDAIVSGGVGGLYMDYILEDYEQGKKDLTKDLAGPVLGRMLPDAFAIYQEMMKGVTGGDSNVTGTAVNKLTRWFPMQNLWYGKPTLDMLFLDNMRQWADPQYERKKMKFMKERSGELWEQTPLYED